MPKFFTYFFLLLSYSLVAQTDSLGMQLNNQELFKLNIKKAKDKVTVDGNLDENDWTIAQAAQDFWMKYPDNKRHADTKTEVRMTYDDHNLYVGITCFDSSSKHIIPTLKRDVNYFDGDGIAVVIDPINRASNAYLFGVSPLGVQSDAALQSFGDPVFSWDNKWLTEVKQYVDRWTVEIAIPFKTLRYEAGKTTWGINFVRNDIKHGQYHTWARVPLQFDGIALGFYGSLVWDAPPPVEKGNVVLIPYLLGGVSKDAENDGKTDQILRGGADAKIAVSSQLNLDATINPDFSQVDVDDQVANLTRFSLFFPERRTFFLENSDILSELGSMGARPFFSRRIGLDDNGQRVPIQFGARLSGNLNKSLRINAFDMQTAKTDNQHAQNYAAVAVQQALRGRSFVKLGVLNKQDMSDSVDYVRNLSGELSFTSKNNQWDAWLLGHHSIQSKAVGESSFVESGVWYHNETFSFLVDYSKIGTNYSTGMDFIPRLANYDDLLDTTIRIGSEQVFTDMNYKYIPKNSSSIAQNYVQAVNAVIFNPNGSFNYRTSEFSNELSFKNTSQVTLSIKNEDTQLPVNVSFTDDVPLPPARYKFTNATLSYTSDFRRIVGYELSTTLGEFYNGKQQNFSVGFNYRRTPWGVFGLRFERYDLQFPSPHNRSLLYLIKTKAEFSFTKNLIWTTFLQYNTQADNFNINSRLQWRYKPMSDLFIVYTDNYAANPFFQKNRALVLKLNYWFNL